MHPQFSEGVPGCEDEQEGPNVGVIGLSEEALKARSDALGRLVIA